MVINFTNIAFKTIGNAQNVTLAKLKNVVIQFMNIAFRIIGHAQNVSLAKLKIYPLETFRQYVPTNRESTACSEPRTESHYSTGFPPGRYRKKVEVAEVGSNRPCYAHRVETETEQGVQFYNQHFNNVLMYY